jgi:subtilisin family serine protease
MMACVARWSMLIGLVLCAGAPAADAPPTAPAGGSTGSWGQPYPDQWALARIGLDRSAEGEGRRQALCPAPQPVVVAVIDSGLDYLHPDFPRDHLWINPQEKLNGVDDDHDGYIDDLIGWNFVDDDNNPWDDFGHGTMIAGIIAAGGRRAPGINPHARIMSLKVLNALGHGSSTAIAAAVDFAIAHEARIINLSLGGERLSQIVARAVTRATDAGVLVVVAAGNHGRDLGADELAGIAGLVIVGATDTHDERAPFSNWGAALSLAAPGIDILGLRARGSDLIATSGASTYREGAALVGEDGQYYRASGTSFAAAMVTGVASWLVACRPQLKARELQRILTQSARDIGPPGVDVQTGYGLVDLPAALASDPGFFIQAEIDSVTLIATAGAPQLRVSGSADASAFGKAVLRAAPESFPSDWIELDAALTQPVRAGTLAQFDTRLIRGQRRWLLQLVTQASTGQTREARYLMDLGSPP